jgi:hypothetical protein
MATPPLRSRSSSRTPVSNAEKFRLTLMFLFLVGVLLFIAQSASSSPSNLIEGEAWYWGEEQKLKRELPSEKSSNSTRLKEQRALRYLHEKIASFPFKEEYLQALQKNQFPRFTPEDQSTFEKEVYPLPEKYTETLKIETRKPAPPKIETEEPETPKIETEELGAEWKFQFYSRHFFFKKEGQELQLYRFKFPFILRTPEQSVEWNPERLKKLQEDTAHKVEYQEQIPDLTLSQKIATMTQEEIEEAVLQQNKIEKITYEHFVKVPEKVVGLFAEFHGTILEVRHKTNVPENPFGLKEVWECYLYDRDYVLYTVRLLDPPWKFHLKDDVTVRGVFFKILTFETNSGEKRETPLFIARTLNKLSYQKKADTGGINILILVVVGIGSLALALGIFIEIKRSKKLRETLLQKKKENHERLKKSKISKKIQTETSALSPPADSLSSDSGDPSKASALSPPADSLSSDSKDLSTDLAPPLSEKELS